MSEHFFIPVLPQKVTTQKHKNIRFFITLFPPILHFSQIKIPDKIMYFLVMKKRALLTILFIPIALTVIYASADGDTLVNMHTIEARYNAAVNRLKEQGRMLRRYAAQHHYNTEYCLLVDMSLPSGKKRLFIYNLINDSIEFAGLVANGVGSYRVGSEQLIFSNTVNSGMTSLGKYSVGNSYYGKYGLAHKLHGLDSTNSNAYKRTIVLHSHAHMPDIEVYPDLSPSSAGCPMVSADCLVLLSRYIKASKDPILLWIYN